MCVDFLNFFYIGKELEGLSIKLKNSRFGPLL
jgi:hypothetical protein